eukprot:TRINITY_DN4192_c0_g1_i4.p1 TRINITY_DN4192_c0_g1~~TRINITY_DN4192_c0_g1_i4.p1  ORF type:complete len:249 (+),score=57.39 TRINITY_DN4192_c0_g1_i4:423-1169(+)
MKRTASRALPSGQLSLNEALNFGMIIGIVGTLTLLLKVNALATILAFGNIILYALVYTPMKRYHWSNTWVGAIVGAIPPLIGWAANTGGTSVEALLLGYVLFMWQISHFLALSWQHASDYGNAGHKMFVLENKWKVASLVYVYALCLLPVPFFAYYISFMTAPFMFTGTVLNLWFINVADDFVINKSHVSAVKTFRATLSYLPLLLLLMLFHKEDGYAVDSDDDDSDDDGTDTEHLEELREEGGEDVF